jgi:hypothetical protein
VRLGKRLGHYASAAGPIAMTWAITRPCLAYAAAGYVKSLSREGAYCRLGGGFLGPFGSTGGRSATPFARLRRL